jgi:hypothetical protein
MEKSVTRKKHSRFNLGKEDSTLETSCDDESVFTDTTFDQTEETEIKSKSNEKIKSKSNDEIKKTVSNPTVFWKKSRFYNENPMSISECMRNLTKIDSKDNYVKPIIDIGKTVKLCGEHVKYTEIEYLSNKKETCEKFSQTGVQKKLQDKWEPELNKLHLHGYLVTCNYDTYTSFEKAWETVNDKVDNTVKALYKSDIPIHLICSTIENVHEIPKTHKEKPIYLIKNEKELMDIYSTCKIQMLKNIDLGRYTSNLLNIITEYIYTATLHERDLIFTSELYNYQKMLSKYVDEGMHFPFEIDTKSDSEFYRDGDIQYKMTPLLFLAYCQETHGPTTLGYPHIHISLLLDSSENYEDLIYRMREIVCSTTGLIDTRVDRRKQKKSDNPAPTSCLMYVFKNHSCGYVVESLNRYSKERENKRPIVTSYVTSKQHQKILTDMLVSITKYNKKDIHSSNPLSYNKSISMTIINIVDSNAIEYSFPMVDAEANRNKLSFLRFVQNRMHEKNYSIYKDKIFVKCEGSRSSYKFHNTINGFMLDMGRTLEHDTKMSRQIIEWMSNPLTETDVNFEHAHFPRIDIHFRMFEFKDFYYDFVTRAIYINQFQFTTSMYFPHISLSNLNEKLTNFLESSVWIEQLKASGVYTLEDISTLYGATLNRLNRKRGVIALIGDADTGKSSILLPFSYMYPDFLIGNMQEYSDHHVSDQVDGKLIVFVNEGNTLLRSVCGNGKLRGPGLLILEGGRVTSNIKHGKISSINSAKLSIVMSINSEIADIPVFDNEPLMKRIMFIRTISGLVDKVSVYEKDDARKQCPLVVLFCAMCDLAMNNNSQFIPNIPVYDEMSEYQFKFINNSIIKDDVNLCEEDYSEEKIKNISHSFTEFEYKSEKEYELPIRSHITQEAIIESIKTHLKNLVQNVYLDVEVGKMNTHKKAQDIILNENTGRTITNIKEKLDAALGRNQKGKIQESLNQIVNSETI